MIVKHMELFCYVIFPALLLSIGLIKAQPALADHLSAPVHHISMEFNLGTKTLSANSRIELPAGAGLQLDLSYLNVSQILVNGQPGETSQDTPYLDIHESTEDQEIFITYNREIQPDSDSYSLISATGITLSNHWYPAADREMLFKLTAMIPADFEAISEAEEIIIFARDNKKQVTFRFPHPLHNINFVAGPYSIT